MSNPRTIRERIKGAWNVLRAYRCFALSTMDENCTSEALLIGAYHAIAMKLHELGYLPKERLDMALTLLRDPSVIMLSKGDDGKCYAAYDCQSEDDFNDLRFCEIE